VHCLYLILQVYSHLGGVSTVLPSSRKLVLDTRSSVTTRQPDISWGCMVGRDVDRRTSCSASVHWSKFMMQAPKPAQSWNESAALQKAKVLGLCSAIGKSRMGAFIVCPRQCFIQVTSGPFPADVLHLQHHLNNFSILSEEFSCWSFPLFAFVLSPPTSLFVDDVKRSYFPLSVAVDADAFSGAQGMLRKMRKVTEKALYVMYLHAGWRSLVCLIRGEEVIHALLSDAQFPFPLLSVQHIPGGGDANLSRVTSMYIS